MCSGIELLNYQPKFVTFFLNCPKILLRETNTKNINWKDTHKVCPSE